VQVIVIMLELDVLSMATAQEETKLFHKTTEKKKNARAKKYVPTLEVEKSKKVD
jgi:hypothetical protein